MLHGGGEKSTLLILLVGIQTSSATMESSVEAPQTIENGSTI